MLSGIAAIRELSPAPLPLRKLCRSTFEAQFHTIGIFSDFFSVRSIDVCFLLEVEWRGVKSGVRHFSDSERVMISRKHSDWPNRFCELQRHDGK